MVGRIVIYVAALGLLLPGIYIWQVQTLEDFFAALLVYLAGYGMSFVFRP